jgi:hypothetical protein
VRQIVVSSVAAWIFAGLVFLVSRTLFDRSVTASWEIAVLSAIGLVLVHGIASTGSSGYTRTWDALIGTLRGTYPDRQQPGDSGNENEIAPDGLTPLGVAIVVAIEMGVVLALWSPG